MQGGYHEEKKSVEKRIADRKVVKEAIEIVADETKIVALSYDLSATGLRFRTKEPLKIWLRMQSLDSSFVHEARLAWAKKEPDGSMIYGFEFVKED